MVVVWGGGGNDGGVVGFLLCLDQGLSPLFVTFLLHVPDAVHFLVLLVSGDVIGVAGIGGGCRGIMQIHRSPSRPRPAVRPTAVLINIHEHLI